MRWEQERRPQLWIEARAPPVGGALPTSGGVVAATSKDGRGVKGPALGVLERQRWACILGYVVRLGEGTNRGDGVGVGRPAECIYSLGISLSLLLPDVDGWRLQRVTVTDAPIFITLDCPCKIADFDLASSVGRRTDYPNNSVLIAGESANKYQKMFP